jgi:hypothetical protein
MIGLTLKVYPKFKCAILQCWNVIISEGFKNKCNENNKGFNCSVHNLRSDCSVAITMLHQMKYIYKIMLLLWINDWLIYERVVI